MVKSLKLSFIVLLFTFVVPFLAGCEKAYWDDVRNFRLFDSQAEELASASLQNVEMRKDDGIDVGTSTYFPSDMPTGYGAGGYVPEIGGADTQMVGGVELFSLGPMPGQPMGGYGGIPQYGGGMVSPVDSNVLIYDLDVPMQPIAQPMMDVGMMQNGYQAGYQGGYQQGYMPMNGAQVYFNHGSSRLGGNDRRLLSSVAEQAKFAPGRITVSGYASRPTQVGTGSVQAQIINLKESMNRSFAVSKALIQKGVPADKIKTVSWGTAHATGTNIQDQRVDIMMGER